MTKVQKAEQWPMVFIVNRANNEVSVLTFRTYFSIEMWLSLFSISDLFWKMSSFLLKDNFFPFFLQSFHDFCVTYRNTHSQLRKAKQYKHMPEWDRKLFHIQPLNSAYQHNTNKLCKMLLFCRCRRIEKKTWLRIIESVLFDYMTIQYNTRTASH